VKIRAINGIELVVEIKIRAIDGYRYQVRHRQPAFFQGLFDRIQHQPRFGFGVGRNLPGRGIDTVDRAAYTGGCETADDVDMTVESRDACVSNATW